MTDEPSTTPVVVPPSGFPSWGPNTLGVPWIAPTTDQTNADRPGTCCVGDIAYTTTFTISGDPSTAKVTLNLMADDYVNVVVNGNRVFSATNGAMYLTPTAITITSSYNPSCFCYTPFKSGTNTIEFDVHNFGGPTGLSVAAAAGTADAAATGPPTLSVFPNNVIGSAVSGTKANDTVIPVYATNNGGGGTLTFTASPQATSGCSTIGGTNFFLFRVPGVPTPTNQAAPALTIETFGQDPGGNTVPPGIYRTNMRLVSGAQFQDLCINAVVTAKPTPTFNLSQTGVFFSAPVNGTVADQTIPLFANGGSVSWTAKVKLLNPLDNFMTITPTSGTANTSAGTVGSTLTVHMNPQSKAGVHYGVIVLTPQAPSNLPAQEMAVVYNVFANGSVPNITPSALIFVGSTAQNIPFKEQTFSILPSGAAPQSYLAAAVPVSSSQPVFLSLPTPTGTINGGPVSVPVDVVASKLVQGFNLGAVAVQIGSTTQLESVLVVNLPAAVITGSEQPAPLVHRDGAASTCTATQIGVVSTSLPGGFSASVGWPTNLTAIVIDDCGNPISNASVLASFSDGEASLPLTLVDSTTGTYSATWNPAAAGAITLTAYASTPSFSTHTILTGTVVGNNAPRIAPHGVLSNLNPQVGAPLAPGTVASIFGANLAGGTAAGSPGVSPLLTNFQGITATIGGIDVPLYYVNDSQLNVQIPYELASGGTYPVVVSTNNGLSLPDSVTISDASPGVAVYADGTLIAQHLDFTLVNAGSPAAPNETIQMYMVGLGATTPPVATNQPAPSAEPLARAANVTVTVNNENATVLYAGLTPGAIGLYQVDFTIPADIKTSTPAVVISQGSVNANATSVPVVAK